MNVIEAADFFVDNEIFRVIAVEHDTDNSVILNLQKPGE